MKRFLLLLSIPLWLGCGESGTPEWTYPDPSGSEASAEPSSEPSAEPDPSQEPGTWPVLTGSFIQHWYPKVWTQARWDEEMSTLAEVGITYLIYTPMSEDGGETDFRSLERCLKSAASHGVKVLVGPNAHSGWWGNPSGDWLNEQMQAGVEVAQAIYTRFHASYPESLWGWYWDWEVDNVRWLLRRKDLAEAWNITLDGLTAIDPDMPLLFSPFMNTLGEAEDYGDFWTRLFPLLHLRQGDIFCPQDCVGARGIAPEQVEPWLAAMKAAADAVEGLRFWVNIEIFDMYTVGGSSWYATASLRRVLRQMEVAAPYAEALVCFAYSHYFSPLLAGPDYHAAYRQYQQTGRLPEAGKLLPVNSVSRNDTASGAVLEWVVADKSGIAGVALYKNGSLLLKLPYREANFPTSFTEPAGKAADKYEITTYNFLGDESAKVSF
ncbi:MAG: DUF4434 domain-containing protein [Bacteroidales bacterium]|nr:DUF4434 domain-containing protein [Bacteroidales bacterium]